MRTLNSSTVSKGVADFLRVEIRAARLQPGARLRQEEIARQLGVSTTPVREAFRILQAEGLVTLDPHRGVEVFRPTVKDVLEYYEIRETLEMLAIARAIPRLTADDLEDLEDLLSRMDTTNDEVEWVELNVRFHGLIYERSDRPRLCAMISNLGHLTSGYVQMVVQHARNDGKASREHWQILDACRNRDISTAQNAIRTHLHHTVEQTMRYLEGRSIDQGQPERTVET